MNNERTAAESHTLKGKTEFMGNTEYKGWDCTDDLKLEKCNDMKVVDGFNV